MNSEATHTTSSALCLCSSKCTILITNNLTVYLWNRNVQIKSQLQNILTAKDCKRSTSGYRFTVIIASIKHKRLLPSTTLGSHEANIRYASRLLCIIITRLFFKVIAALIRHQKRSCFIVHAFALILWSSEKFKPFLRHLHTCSSTVPTVSSSFPGYNRMTNSSIFIGRMLE